MAKHGKAWWRTHALSLSLSFSSPPLFFRHVLHPNGLMWPATEAALECISFYLFPLLLYLSSDLSPIASSAVGQAYRVLYKQYILSKSCNKQLLADFPIVDSFQSLPFHFYPGYRGCRRCRPDRIPPHKPPWLGAGRPLTLSLQGRNKETALRSNLQTDKLRNARIA
ncbi:uncharacterized protein BO72DRAFT_81387 [Aspergillus fijiensis CBS 313.89]|uniref:Uncharacterized protein n=1 Tax=Aspergillus fijiensis CBS 313.89 TaxID=1448319 RepID=A0A8G1W0G5_9EURO|nr:uncharacterized protein BO72DRAFT_81387 [Aspergillus fijiensis CBS 313.89]RAK78331.1 hypothetical protein BO72DRAFT_81387 [Aspergillus fijiensis CBS 313.89]